MSQYYYNPGNVRPQGPAYMQSTNQAGGKTLQEILGSPLFLATILCLTVSFVLTVAATFFPNPNLTALAELMAQSDPALNAADFYGSFGGSLFGTILSELPNIVLCIGFWLIFDSARKGEVPAASTTGYSMVKIIYIIFAILMILATLGVLLLFGAAIAGTSMASSMDLLGDLSVQLPADALSSIQGILGVVMVIAVAICILTVIYFFKNASAWDISSIVAKQGYRDKKNISLYVIVFNFFLLLFEVISLLGSAFGSASLSRILEVEESAATSSSGYMLISTLDHFFDVVYLLLITIILMKLRSELETLDSVPLPGGLTSNPYAGAYNSAGMSAVSAASAGSAVSGATYTAALSGTDEVYSLDVTPIRENSNSILHNPLNRINPYAQTTSAQAAASGSSYADALAQAFGSPQPQSFASSQGSQVQPPPQSAVSPQEKADQISQDISNAFKNG